MKKSLLLSVLSIGMLLTACGGSKDPTKNPTPEPTPTVSPSPSVSPEPTAPYNPYPDEGDSYLDVLPLKTEDGPILHAFCWTFNQIKSQLPYIRTAGFKSVQTLPVQTPKSNGSAWWTYYQPLSLSIAEDSPLGTKQDLIDLCNAAAEYGISIIVDVVFNHLANIADGYLEEDGTPMVYPGVEAYEPYIYEHRNDAENPTFHHNKNAQGSGAETQYYQWGDLPDLNTGHPYVQQRCLDFLKECIDAGVDGFRFDAAKHIETSEDPDYPSYFWEETLDKAKEYYLEKTGDELFAYGEVLGSPSYRPLSVYTKHMNVIDDGHESSLVTGIGQRSAEMVINSRYGKGCDANLLVPYVESHDTFTSAKSPYPERYISAGWAILGSRSDVRGLYLARTDSAFSVGQIYDYTYRDEIVGAVNRFHNRFVGSPEYLKAASESVVVNERVSKDCDKGAVIVDLARSGHAVVTFDHLDDTNYFDQITGETVAVRDHKAYIKLHSSGICVLTRTHNPVLPTIEISKRDTTFVDNLELTLKVKNAVNASYSINDGEFVQFSKSTKITLTKEMAEDNVITLLVRAVNGSRVVEETFTYKTAELIPGHFNVLGISPSTFENNDIWLWSWAPKAGGYYNQEYFVQDGILLVDPEGLEGFIVVLFTKGYVIPNLYTWDNNCLKQSRDISGSLLEQGFIDLSDAGF